MRKSTLAGSLSLALCALTGCGGDDSGDAPQGSSSTGGGDCALVDDPGPPGQYADSCVKREWVAPYVGSYESPICTLTVTAPASGPAAVFSITITGDTLAGTYAHDWEGGTGPGNDSYYRFTTDATYATTKAESFGVGKKVSDTQEDGIGLRVEGVDTGSPEYSAYFQRTITSPFENTNVECGTLTKK